MRYLVLLSLVALSQCAPVMEQQDDAAFEQVGDEQDKVERMKRAQEVIMYGNEQNVQKVVKKSDPNIDLKGHIAALDPVDIANESPESVETVGSEEQQNTVTNGEEAIEEHSVEQSVESDEKVDDLAEQLLKQEEPEIEESLISGDVIQPELDESAPASEETSSGETDLVSAENSGENGKDSDEEMNDEALQEYLDELYMRQKLEQELQNYYNRYNSYFRPTYRRRRSYRSRRKAMSRRPYVSQDKLNHRSKRDLIYPGFDDDETLDELGPYGDQYIDDGYPEEDPETEYLQEYLDFLDNVRAQEEAERLRSAYNADLEPITYQGEPGYFVPKRQAGLNFVPGMKRDDIFFPAYEEPYTHWGAFVPSKRDYREYADKYERLMQLAALLSGRDNVDDSYDEREYDWDRK